MGCVRLKDPDATLDYSIDWGTSYLQSGETISSSTWAIVPSGSTDDLTVSAVANTTAVASVTANKGRRGVTYRMTNRVITSGGRTDDRMVVVYVEER